METHPETHQQRLQRFLDGSPGVCVLHDGDLLEVDASACGGEWSSQLEMLFPKAVALLGTCLQSQNQN